jgi:hypothetical protein
LVLALIGYLSENSDSSTVEEGQNESAEVTTENESAPSEEDLALIASMSEFLQQGSWNCVEIAKGDGQPMIGATFTFMEDVIVVENFGKRHEVPYSINFVLPDWPSDGTTAAHLNIRSNKEMVARFDTDDNLIMLSWSNDTVKMKLIRNT